MTTPFPAPLRTAPAVLVANRGEIAVRIIRTLRQLALPAIAVYTDQDADAPHVRAADSALRIPDYLDGDAIIAAAHASGAALIHPGYGFLAENAGFARACTAAGLVFVGPTPDSIAAMGDKIRAKQTVAAAGVPVLPGFAEDPGHPLSATDLTAAAAQIGYPLLLKPSAGGGGKGMRLVHSPDELADAAAAARREARAAFGDATLLAERYVARPRHIEVQILADTHGTIVHLGERECSLQRRHQKIVEEAPSPLLTPEQRNTMGQAAVAAARACGYVGAGTVEFIVPGDDTDRFFFLEMNTRLQVEHPVTEAVTAIRGTRGIDLVEAQLRIALGEALPFTQDDITWQGHAIECRIYAEDPARNFLPTGGRILHVAEPHGPGIRVDSGISEGTTVTSAYDPLLAKLVVWDHDRASALRRADAALARTTLLGCGTNTAFLRALLAHPDVAAGQLSTGLVEHLHPELAPALQAGPDVLAAAALDRHLDLVATSDPANRFTIPDGWRLGEPAWTVWRLHSPGSDPVTVRVRADHDHPHRFHVRVADADPHEATAVRSPDGRSLHVTYAGQARHYTRATDGHDLWLGHAGAAWCFRDAPRTAPLRRTSGHADGAVRSPMPGTVLDVPVAVGDTVRAGQTLAVVEAMKMEHPVAAPVDGTVTELHARPGQSVPLDALLAVVTPAAAPAATHVPSTTAATEEPR